jgi:hypothetical protein
MKYLSAYPVRKIINGRVYFRSIGLLHDHSSKAKAEQGRYRKTHHTRLFWTGGQRQPDGSIKKSFFILISPKSINITA